MNSSTRTPRRRPNPPFRSQRGSVLIVAMLFAAIIALSIGSYVRVSQTNLELSNRSFYSNAAINLAESGLEQAMWSINKMVANSSYNWTSDGWTVAGSGASQKFTGFVYDQNATGFVRVYVQNYNGAGAPILLARATIQPQRGEPIEKWIRVDLSKRSLYANGLVAKETISFSGNNAMVDSYDSRKGAYNAVLADGTRNRFGRGSAGSGSVTVDSFNLGNADIFGYVSIGTPDYSGLDVGPNGTVAQLGAAQGTKDYSRVTTDFKPNFEDATAPTQTPYSISSISSALTLPLAGHTPAADGVYYYSTPQISYSGNNKVLSIQAARNVVLLITATSGSGLSVSGNSSNTISVPTSSSLKVYTSANVAISGGGIVNTGNPANFQLISTRAANATGTQSISISGNGVLSAVIYAPNAALTMNGGGNAGNVYGAAVAKTISITGNSSFHYDEALGDLTDGNPFGIVSWDELETASSRASWTSKLAF